MRQVHEDQATKTYSLLGKDLKAPGEYACSLCKNNTVLVEKGTGVSNLEHNASISFLADNRYYKII